MLAQRQLYQANYEAAMRATIACTEYDDILDPAELYSLLGENSENIL